MTLHDLLLQPPDQPFFSQYICHPRVAFKSINNENTRMITPLLGYVEG